MKKYIKYLSYILEHKKNVFKECWKEGLYLHAFTHDLSKFKPSEFIPYARHFYGDYPSNAVLNGVHCINHNIRTKEQVKEEFSWAWKLHYIRNKHHWNHWIGKDMPDKYIAQMICDWKAMSRKFGDTPQEFYFKNYDKMQLSHKTRVNLEFDLGLIDGVCLASNVIWKEYCRRTDRTMEEDLELFLGFERKKAQWMN